MIPALNVKILPCHPQAKVPKRAHLGDGGADLYAVEPQAILEGERALVPLGLKSEFASSLVARIVGRSGLAVKGIDVHPGTIDSGYRGEWQVLVINNRDDTFFIAAGDRIAQVIVHPVFQVQFEKVGELTGSTRDVGGFGSTGLEIGEP